MSSSAWRRIGDPAAPRLIALKGGRVWTAVVVVAIIALGTWLLGYWISVGDTDRIVATSIGLPLSLLFIVGFRVWWVRRLARLGRSLAAIAESHSDRIVVGARIPPRPAGANGAIWPPNLFGEIAPQEAVLAVGSADLLFFSLSSPSGAAVLRIDWSDVSRVYPVEFVQSGTAYQGVFIEGVGGTSGLAFQPTILERSTVTFPRDEQLETLCSQLEHQRGDGQR